MNKSQIQNSSTAIEQRTIRKHYSEDEMNDIRESFSGNEIKKAETEDELSGIKKEFKANLDSLKDRSKELRTKIKNKYVDINRDVYCVPNFTDGIMEFYDCETAELLDTRKLRPNEKQLSIIEKTA